MMKMLIAFFLLGLAGPAAAGYKEALGLVRLDAPQAKALDGFLAMAEEDLSANEPLEALLNANRPAIDAFIKAAGEPTDGYLFGAKPEKLTMSTPVIKYGEHIQLFKLLLIDARVNAQSGFVEGAERDLLAAAGFLSQLSEQKAGLMITSLTYGLCVRKAFAPLAASMREESASPAYLGALARKLARAQAAMDFMRGAMQEEAELSKNTVRETMNVLTIKKENAKLPMHKELVAKALQDQAFFDMVYTHYNDAASARAEACAKAFEANDPALCDGFVEKQLAWLSAKAKAYEALGFMDSVKAGTAGLRSGMADYVVAKLTAGSVPQYGRLVEPYNVSYSILGVLRTALAVKAYKARNRGRLPGGLVKLPPGFIDELPRDPFNKFQPFTYASAGKKFTVYGYGPDRADGGGRTQLDAEAYGNDQAKASGDILYEE
ncbi:MAG: hypothetical protein HY952_12245 [Elusimicrobia bacterium]|nr:hypothetical protein [Elusimicrobiota bacterium]